MEWSVGARLTRCHLFSGVLSGTWATQTVLNRRLTAPRLHRKLSVGGIVLAGTRAWKGVHAILDSRPRAAAMLLTAASLRPGERDHLPSAATAVPTAAARLARSTCGGGGRSGRHHNLLRAAAAVPTARLLDSTCRDACDTAARGSCGCRHIHAAPSTTSTCPAYTTAPCEAHGGWPTPGARGSARGCYTHTHTARAPRGVRAAPDM